EKKSQRDLSFDQIRISGQLDFTKEATVLEQEPSDSDQVFDRKAFVSGASLARYNGKEPLQESPIPNRKKAIEQAPVFQDQQYRNDLGILSLKESQNGFGCANVK